MTENGCFEAHEKVCLSITDYHPESWNPAWTVTHIILGCISFWLQDEETAGSCYYNSDEEKSNMRKRSAWSSRKRVLAEPKFEECLGFYKEFIGINDEPEVEHWKIYIQEEEDQKKAIELEKIEVEKAAAEEKAKAEAEEKAKVEAEEKAKAEAQVAEVQNKLKDIIIHFAEDLLPKLEELQMPIKMAKAKSHFEEINA